MTSNQTGRFRRMSELSNYTIEQGDPDPRGCSVIASDGSRMGTVVDLLVDTTSMKVRQLLVDPSETASGRNANALVTLDVADVDVRPDTRQVVARGTATAGRSRHRTAAG